MRYLHGGLSKFHQSSLQRNCLVYMEVHLKTLSLKEVITVPAQRVSLTASVMICV
jgi:hypothetical protein